MARKRSSFFHQSELRTLIPLSNAPRFYVLKTTQHSTLARNRNKPHTCAERNYSRTSVLRFTTTPIYRLLYRYRMWSGFTYLKPNATFSPCTKVGAGTNTCAERELFASKRSPFYYQTGLRILILLSNAIRFHILKTKPNIQPRQETWSESQVLAPIENYWRLLGRRSIINPSPTISLG